MSDDQDHGQWGSVVVGSDRFDVRGDGRLAVGDVIALLSPGSPLVAVTTSGVALAAERPWSQAVPPGGMLVTEAAHTAGTRAVGLTGGPPSPERVPPPRGPARSRLPSRSVAAVALGGATTFGLLAWVVLLRGWPAGHVSAVALAAAVLLSRSAPELALRTSRDLLLDVGGGDHPWCVDRAEVRSLVMSARATQTALLVVLSLLAVTAAASLVPADLHPSTASVLLLGASGVALLQTCHAYRRRADRCALLVPAGCALVAATVPWLSQARVAVTLGVTATAVVLAVTVLALTRRRDDRVATRRIRLPFWVVRLGDGAAALCVLAVPALALWACGAVDLVSTLTR